MVAKPVLKLYNGREGKPGLMDVEWLCAYISEKKSWVYQHIKEIPHYKLCGHLRFRKEKIDAWLESQEVQIGGKEKEKPKGRRLDGRRDLRR